jgi:alkylation response protein AidB-like acyl-CoA dehydrogenase
VFELSDDHRAVRDMARDFARNEILPGATERDRSHQFPADLVGKLAELGLLGMFVPSDYGGAGLDILSYVLALEEISYADAGVAVVMSVQNSLAGWPILTFGTHAQKLAFLEPLATGRKIGCYALTEPSVGSDAGALRTRAEKVDGGYLLDGTKMWITNGPQAEVVVTYANLDPLPTGGSASAGSHRPASRHKGICAFVVETPCDGYAVGKIEEKMGIRCSSTSELVFSRMFVPEANRLEAERDGFRVAMATLDGGRIGIAAQALGIAQRALDLAVAYAKERTAFSKPIAQHQAIQFKIADMRTRIEAARLLTWRAAWMKDRQERASAECSMAKLFASETANFVAYEAVQIFGGYGYSQEYEVERLYRDARITTLYEGTSEIQRIVVSKATLGDS